MTEGFGHVGGFDHFTFGDHKSLKQKIITEKKFPLSMEREAIFIQQMEKNISTS